MKQISCFFILLLALTSCKNENEMTLNTTITGLKKGTVYLQRITDSTLVNLDSLVIDGDESFSLATEVSSPEVLYLYLDKNDGTDFNDRVPFFAEKGELTLKTHLDKLNSEVAISGGKHHKVFDKYNKSMKSVNTALSQTNLEFIQAQLKNDDEAIVVLDEKLNKLLTSKYLRAIQFALNHKKSPVAAYIGAREIPEANVKYLDSIYNGLSKKAKESIYGKELAEIIAERKK